MTSDQLSVVDQVLTHLCHKGLYGDVVEWCEMRNDCVYVVTCPECRTSFTLLDEEYEALIERIEQAGLACGVRPVSA
jgi:hypothetical protein